MKEQVLGETERAIAESPFKEVTFSSTTYALAWQDLREGLQSWRIWLLLAWQSIQLRYRRSTLGPFWITLSMAVTIYTMGLLYGGLFKVDLSSYYPFLATGILGWSLISALLTESASVFIDSELFIKQIKQPYSIFIFQSVTRSFIIFSHHILVLVPIIFFFKVPINVYTWFTLISLALIWLNGVFYGSVLAMLGTRYRDIVQLIMSLVQVIFFLTPIIWPPSALPERYRYLIDYNPFAQFMELLRYPLLGKLPSTYTLYFSVLITLFGAGLFFIVFARYRARIAYWL